MLLDRRAKLLSLVLLVGFAIRVISIFVFADLTAASDWEYGEIARNIVNGNGFARVPDPGNSLELTSSHAPLYPLFLALFYKYGTGRLTYIIMFMVQAFLSTMTISVLYRIALNFNERTAMITAICAALYPPFVYYSFKLTPTTLFLFLISISILLLISLRRDQSVRALISGGMCGITMLCNPICGVLIPAFVLYQWVEKNIKSREWVMVLLGAVLLVIPWTVRNYLVHHRIVPITSQFSINLWIGNNPHATGTDYYESSAVPAGMPVLMTKTLPRRVKQYLDAQPEITRADFFLHAALSFIKENPAQFLYLFLKKTWYYWWFPPTGIAGSPDASKYRVFYIIAYLPLIILSIAGMIKACVEKRTPLFLFTVATIIMISSIYILTHVGLLRYRIPVEMLLLLSAGFTIDWMVGSAQKHIRTSADQGADYQK
jgi:hypothetical protein